MRARIAVALLSVVVVVPAVAATQRIASVPPPDNLINPHALVTVNPEQPATYLTLAGRRCDPVAKRDDTGADVKMADARDAADSLRIVQFEKPISDAQAKWLAARGIATVGFIPDNGYIVRITATDTAALAAQPGVRWVGAYAPEYRYGRRLQLALQGRAGRMTEISVRVFFAPYVAADTAQQAVGSLGSIEAIRTTGDGVVIDATLATAKLADLAAQPDVLVIEYRPQAEVCNNVAADVVDARAMWNTHGYYGGNEIVAVADSGLDIGVTDATVHLDFQDGAGQSRVLAIQDFLGDGGDDPYSGHGTFVAGSILGNGHLSGADPTNNYFPTNAYVGMAPKASLCFQALGSNNPAASSQLYPPANLSTLFTPAYTAGARIHVDSWGTTAYGDYNLNLNARDTDMFCFERPDMLIVFSAGNDGVDVVAPLGVVDPGQISSPGLAKNVLCVGASENDRPTMPLTWGGGWPSDFPNLPISTDLVANIANGMAGFSSRGPCSDGRIKPDMVAPGTYLASTKSHAAAGSVLWGDVPGNTNYAYGGGTSMAGGLVAGAAATLREYLRVNRGMTNPPAALLKAALLCGASDMAPGQYGTGSSQEITNAPNIVQGWGRLTLEDSLYGGGSPYQMNFWTNAFTDAATFVSTVTVYDASYPLKAVLCWTDVAGSQFGLNDTYSWIAGGGLINDLDLHVIDPSGATNYPRAMNPRLDLFYYTNTTAQGYNSPVGMYEAEKCTAPDTPLTITHIYQILYDTTGAGGSYGTFIWSTNAGGLPGTVLYASTGTVAAGSAGFKYRLTTLASPVTITNSTFYIGSQLLSANLLQLRDNGIGVAGSPRTYSTWTGSWTADNDPDMWIHALGTVSNGDHVNTVEGVIIDSPATGAYKIVVSGRNVPFTPVRCGVAISGGLVEAGKSDQTISSFLPTNGSAFVLTDSVGLSASASSGLPVAFAVDSGPGGIDGTGTNLTFSAVGTVLIVASQAGDANWNEAPSLTNALSVSKSEQAALVFTPATPQTYNTTAGLSTTGGSGTGEVSYAVQSGPGTIVGDTNLTVTSGTGSVTVVATKAADDFYNAIAATATVACAKANQAITYFLPTNGSAFVTTDNVDLSALASSGLPVSFVVGSGPGAIASGTNLSFTGAGLVEIVVSQEGDSNYSAAPVDTNTFVVSKVEQSALVFTPTTPQTYNTTNALSATGGSGTGTVSYAVIAGAGQIAAGTNLAVTSGTGSVMVVATKAADDFYNAIAATATVACAKATQTINFPAIADQHTTNVLGLAATASSGLGVSFSVAAGPAGIFGGTNLIFSGSGTVSVRAAQAGDSNYDEALTVTNTFNVNKSEQAALVFTPTTPQTYNTTNPLSATGGSGTGTVSYAVQSGPGSIVGGASLRVTSGTGSVTVVATKPGDTMYDSTATTATVVCAKASQTINFPAIADQLTTNHYQLAASASSALGVTFSVEAGPATLTGGTNLSFTGAGSVSIVASQTGDDNWAVAPQVTNTFNVTKATAAVTLNDLNQTYDGTAREVTASTVPAGLTVDITYDGSATAPVNVGTYTVTGMVNDATYGGSATGALTVTKADQAINFPQIPRQRLTNVVHLSATASSGLPVTFGVESGPAVLADGTNLTFNGVGAVVIRASQSGDANWNAATDELNRFRVGAGASWTDYDGDGLSDLAVFNDTTARWYIRKMTGPVLAWDLQWGYTGAIPVPGDYNGDGLSDLAVNDPQNGRWYVRTLAGKILLWNTLWGYDGTRPVPGDYDGDGLYDLAVFDEASAAWYIRSLQGKVLAWSLTWGYAGAIPVPGDYDGDGFSDLAVYDPQSGRWYIRTLAGKVLLWDVRWGYADARPVPGDYNGDGIFDLCVQEEATGLWYVRDISGHVLAWGAQWGFAGGIPVPGDYDGDGLSDLTVYGLSEPQVPATYVGHWYIRRMGSIVLKWEYSWGGTNLWPVGSEP